MKKFKNYILICGGTGCESSKADDIYRGFTKELAAHNLQDETQVIKTGCFGFCEKGPIVKILPDESFYVHVKPEDVQELVAEHIVKGRRVDRLLYDAEAAKSKKIDDIGFYQKQVRVVLRNCGFIDPENINEYIARDGYAALEKVLFEISPDDVIEELKKSGLRGRGGAGFPTWRKWMFTKDAPTEDGRKFIVCNADEGDPGAYMDRSLIEGDPHSVIEGMITAGKAIGSNHGFVYIRAEYPLAIDRLKIALEQASEYGLLGKNILGSGFDFEIEIRLGAGAFVCGEETGLIKSIEGQRGMPVPKPPFPANKGLWGMPTLINNVETLVNIPLIMLDSVKGKDGKTVKGSEYLANMGTEKSKGTKVFALTGKVKNSGLVEVPMGTTLREIIFEIGGGIKDGKKFKGVQTGGPSGGILTEKFLDIPIDFESLTANGSMMGSGGMIVMDEDDCVVDVARFYMDFCVDESCGKCSPCRIGTSQLHNILEKIANGNGEESDLQQLDTISKAMVKASLCALGQTAPNPILSTIKNFKEEYMEHIIERKCRAGKCKNLVQFKIDLEKCIGCGICVKKCPADCIYQEDAAKFPNKKKAPYSIDNVKCVKCGECVTACKFKAVLKA